MSDLPPPSPARPTADTSALLPAMMSGYLSDHPQHVAPIGRLVEALAGADARRFQCERDLGIELPETIILALTSVCDQRCPSCGARDLVQGAPVELSRAEVEDVIDQARALGIHRFALTGGEPLRATACPAVALVRDHPDCLFSIFTNGTAIDDSCAATLGELSNALLVLNVGAHVRLRGAASNPCPDSEHTIEPDHLRNHGDSRHRGRGRPRSMSSWIAGLEVLLRRMAHHGLLFAVAAPVTASNEHLLDHTEPFARFARLGARLAVLFDYAPPFGVAADPLSLSPSARRRFVARARKAAAEVSLPLMCVPEDETILGGCTAAGRLVVYVSPLGTIDPCPFVPYSGFHLSSHRLLDAIRSPFFSELRSRSRAWEGSASPECVIDAAGPQACGCVYRRHPEEFDELCRRHGAKLHSLYR